MSPKLATIDANELLTFSVTGRSTKGEVVPVDVEWSATGGTLFAGGSYYSRTPGSYTVYARVRSNSSMTDSAVITVIPPAAEAVSVEIDPGAATVLEGDTTRFSAKAYFSDGTVKTVTPDWEATGGDIGHDGAFRAGIVPGEFEVAATLGTGLADRVRVSVMRRAQLIGLNLRPDNPTLPSGGTVAFQTTATWSDGGTRLPRVKYSATGGVIDGEGVYRAGSRPGVYQVMVASQQDNVADTTTVTITSGPVARVTLEPGVASIVPGATVQFAITGYDAAGQQVVTTPVWTATGGTVSSAGLYTAGNTTGTYRVIVRDANSSAADTSSVTINSTTATVTALTVSPQTATLAAGQTGQFAVSATWSNGSTAVPAVTWSATGGSVSSAGAYTAGSTAGVYRVVAKVVGSSVADTASVTVTPAIITGITVSPSSAIVNARATAQFTATAQKSDGTTGAAPVTWAATGGSVSSSGIFTADSIGGTFAVTATCNCGQADTASVVVNAPATLRSVVLSPASATVTTGGSQQFTFTGSWSDGASGPLVGTYSATGGTISTNGLFVAASTVGTYRVIAQAANGMADTSSVSVTASPPTLIGLDLTPATVSLQPGSSIQFTTTGIWTNGGSGTPAVTYSATGGSINSTGRYTAGSTVGNYRVIVTDGVRADTSAVTILTPAATLTQLTVSPDPASVAAGTLRQFSVSALWSDGTTTVPPVTWSATGGSISSGSYLAGTNQGTYRVVATHSGGTISDTAAVTITAPILLQVVLSPGTTSVQAGRTQQFAVAGTWSDGSTSTPSVTYTATGGTVSTSGLYTAGNTAGTFRVIARQSGGTVADTSAVTITTVTLTTLSLNPSSASLLTGATQQFSVSGVWSDGTTTPPAVTYSATGGTITTAGLYTAGSTAGTFRVIATQQNGTKADTSTVTISSNVTLQSVSVAPATVSMVTGGMQQFTATGNYSNGQSNAIAVNWSATGGTISSSGLYTAGNTTGTYRAIGIDPVSGKADTSSITINNPAPPNGNFTPWLSRDWSTYSSKTAAATAGFGVEGSPAQCAVPADQTWDLVPDPLWGKAIRYLGDPSFNAPGYTVGCTAIHGIDVTAGPRQIWVRQYIKYSSTWTPLPGTGYKVMFFRFQTNGRMQIEVAPTAFYNRSDAPNAGGPFIYRNPVPSCPGWAWPTDRGIPQGMFKVTYDCSSDRSVSWAGQQEWWEYVMGYLPVGNTLTQVWAYRKYTSGGTVNPGPWTVDIRQVTGYTWQGIGHYEMGVNRNAIYEDTMHIDWGPYVIVDGATYRNPFGIPGVP